jgi:hypothetical protein
MSEIIGVAWRGGTYGIKIPERAVRFQNFDRRWGTVTLLLQGHERPVEVNIDKESFWDGDCGELIATEIGRWMASKGLAPWPRGNPPHFRLRPISPGVFEVSPIH